MSKSVKMNCCWCVWGIATIMVRPSLFGAMNSTWGILQKVSVHANLIDGGLAARGRHIREKSCFCKVWRPLATTLKILLRKKLPSPNCRAVPYKVSPQSFLIALTVSSPYTGSLAKLNNKIYQKVQKSKNDFLGFWGDVSPRPRGLGPILQIIYLL